MKPRWRVGEGYLEKKLVYRGDQLAGMMSSPELAEEVVASLNGVAPNDREGIVQALRREANRIFNSQVQDYPSNVLDVVAWNLSVGENEFLTVKAHPSGRGIERVPPPTETKEK